jgi:hypothetical protein
MSKVILYLCFNRRKETNLSLSFLEKCLNISEYSLVVVRQNGNSDVAQLINNIKFIKTHHLITEYRSNSYSSINQNMHLGLTYCFDLLKAESVLILEDDLLVSPDILNFTSKLIEKYKFREDFRSVNCFSAEKFNKNIVREYSLFSYGIGQGWCISNKTWNKLKIFWTGNENMHFDALVEPFMKTGFVCMPSCSRIKNIGWGISSSHSPQNENNEFYVNLENSWVNHSEEIISEYFFNQNMVYFWRNDCKSYHGSKILSKLNEYLFFLKFFIKKIFIIKSRFKV